MWSHSSPEDLSARPLRQQQASTGPLDMANPDVFRNVATDSADAAGSAAAHERDAGTAVWHTSLFATPTAKQSAGNHLACNISANSVLKAPVDPVRVTPHTMVGKHMGKIHGAHPAHRMDRPGRKSGGRVGADRSPLSSAHGMHAADNSPKTQEGGMSK